MNGVHRVQVSVVIARFNPFPQKASQSFPTGG
jgi:hypothetical protein